MDTDYKDTLRWVNVQRALRGYARLEQLRRWKGCVDPIEHSFEPIRCRVGYDQIWIEQHPSRVLVVLPAAVQRFIEKCDRGDYDDLLGPLTEACQRDLHQIRCGHSVAARIRRTY